MGGAPGSADPLGGLEGIRATLVAGNPQLYRHLALYLQTLRAVLPQRVEQACFHLATQVHVQRYLQLPRSERLALHRQLADLVRRCSSLLTVEQLAALARQMERERLQARSREQRQLLQQMMRQAGGGEHSPAAGSSGGEGEADLPPGSIRLDLSPPLGGSALPWPEVLPQEDPALQGEDDGFGEDGEDSAEDLEPALEDDGGADGQDPGGQTPGEVLPFGMEIAPPLPLVALQGLELGDVLSQALAAAESSGHPPAPSPSAGGGVPPPGNLPSEGEAGAEANGESSPWSEATLPQDPVQLLRWLEGLEQALVRRLRNLSHALNVALLRSGLSRGLLPVSLLDAVLQGQIATMASPANVVHLQLPFGLRPDAPPLQAVAILLRPVDLEMEEPRLRTCRRRLHQHRQEVRRMARQYRRLQRRLQAHEAERLWLQDIRASRPRSDG